MVRANFDALEQAQCLFGASLISDLNDLQSIRETIRQVPFVQKSIILIGLLRLCQLFVKTNNCKLYYRNKRAKLE